MVFKPQNTNFQIKLVENLKTLSSWAINPWRRYSLSLIVLLFGYFLGSSLGMISAVVELMDPVAAFFSVVLEVLVRLRRICPNSRRGKLTLQLIDFARIGLLYGLLLEGFKLL